MVWNRIHHLRSHLTTQHYYQDEITPSSFLRHQTTSCTAERWKRSCLWKKKRCVSSWLLLEVNNITYSEMVKWHLSPRIFNPKLQPQDSTPDLSTPDFSIENFSTPDFSTIYFVHFNPGLFNPMVQKFRVEKSRDDKFTVEKLRFERSGAEAWGWKNQGWNVLQPPNTLVQVLLSNTK